MSEWAKKWLVNFSPTKTKAMLISTKHNPLVHPPLVFDGTILEEISKHKHLGLTLQDDLKWNTHIDNICVTANKRLDILLHLKYKLDRKCLEIMYTSYIRPTLEYASAVWDNCTDQNSDKLELVQKRAARIISGAIIRTPTETIYEELGWSSLKERRKIQRLKMLHKIIKNESPSYLFSAIPQQVQERTVYNLRNRNDISTQFSRTEILLIGVGTGGGFPLKILFSGIKIRLSLFSLK